MSQLRFIFVFYIYIYVVKALDSYYTIQSLFSTHSERSTYVYTDELAMSGALCRENPLVRKTCALSVP